MERRTSAERSQMNVETIPDADLFYVDTNPDAKPEENKLSRKEKYRQRLTKAQSILLTARQAKPVISANVSVKSKRNKTTQSKKPVKNALVAVRETSKAMVPKEGEYNIWTKEKDDYAIRTKTVKAIQRWKKEVSKSPAVEIDAPGCSYNPEFELHQAVVAEAVAVEMKKQYDRELLPTAPPEL